MLGALVAVATAVLVSMPTPASAQSDPVAEAEAAVATARAEADAAADAYFDVLTRAETLDAEIETSRDQLDDLEAETGRLRTTLRARAAEAYVRSGAAGVEFGLTQEEEALETARGAALLDRLNQQDDDLAEQVGALRQEVEEKRAQLEADRAAFEETLTLLQEEQARLDAKLADAQALHNTAVAERRAAEQAAAAAAAAAAAEAEAEAAAEAPEPDPAPTATPEPAATSATPSAPTPPASYAPTPGQHPQHSHPFLVCTRTIESSGNYSAVNPSGPYYGAYQFLQSTWNSAANHAGRGELIGVVPSQASPYDQDDMAWTLYQWQGKGPWGGRC